jgi:2-C-methyl-D-erythritol 4-phosphate cytidylyltransferase
MPGASGPVALLVAAGSGERLGHGRPKALVEVAGRTLLDWSLAALRAAGIDQVVVALPEGAQAPPGCIAVRGGATRSASVRAALAAAPPGDVVVHDAARPLAEPELFARAIEALQEADCAIAAAPVTDTIKQAADGVVTATLDRKRLWAVQTPQAFRRDALERALDVPADVLAQATDDAWLVERAGGSVRIVESSAANFKITTPHDLRVAELLLSGRH